ncbi:late promoter transcription accessory protein [Salmonella phage vB_SenM-AKM_NP4]|uniref:Late transcription coactivator n=4 Tax=Gelderlandvirus TaxID=1913653 RepID=M1EAB9_BPS16|nr:late promoter transcriptional regulator [Salmonella phage vB_SenM-S16]YP_009126184.1 late promoter transcriptional regulator [Salmonella phage STP4-a]YP_009147968.1 late promoter transcriptional regulator [Salmonella phage STML-198]YP_009615723.1 late promoter transcriptional regulator [Salmonella phage Melville]UPW42351.1 RNA polymerase-associated protein [Salmonella phage CF-SP2]WDR21905.1 late transcriptional regulator [Salmonella phage vB_SenM_UTK0003]WKV23586.1 RNA polymerase-associat
MTLFSLNDETIPVPSTKEKNDKLNELLDKQQNGFIIEALVEENGLGYLEATTMWMEENSIPETMYSKFIPSGIIEKIRSEAIDEHMLRPSVSRGEKTNTLEFLL